jgi:hypothetical protein
MEPVARYKLGSNRMLGLLRPAEPVHVLAWLHDAQITKINGDMFCVCLEAYQE